MPPEMKNAAADLNRIRCEPAYYLGEAAGYLRLPVATLRSWVAGRSYATAAGTRRFHPLIEPAERDGLRLSFINLVEAHVLSAIRREHNVSLRNVRKALDYVTREFETKRPLVATEFETDGIDLFVEKYGNLINASQHGQVEMKQVIRGFLKRIRRDADGVPIKLFPFTRHSRNLDQPHSIEIDPRVSFGRPVLAGSGIRAEILVERFLAGESSAELAKDYGRTEAEIQEAIRFEKLAA